MTTALPGVLLAIDSSGADLVLAARAPDGREAVLEVGGGGRHQDRIAQSIDTVLGGLGGAPALAAIAVVVGPGSYTGTRVGMATAAGMAYPRRLPLIPLSSLAVTAWESDADRVVAAVEAGRGRVHAQVLERRDGAPQALGASRILAREGIGAERGFEDVPIVTRGMALGSRARSHAEALLAAAAWAFYHGGVVAYDGLKGDYGELSDGA
jgi:tRNA threonylcarbamoyl adenosine modification protein YeaZ